jgi:DNA repair protein RecN (Recombination protein N)
VLTQLHVHNLAVVDEVDLEFHAGFAALTGETGAGKSILVDALALALGERADSRAIRTGTDRCEITAGFDLGARPDLLRWLADNDLDEDSECIVRRVVTSEGRSRGYVNGRTVPMQTLRELGERLIDFCGQQSHQSLRHASVQRKIVDQFGGHQALLSTVAEAFDQWQTAQTELDALSEAQQERAERRELLSYQAEELRALDVQAGEVAELEREHLRAANSGRIADGVSGALHSLYEADTGTAHAALSASKRELDELSALDERLTPITELLTEAEIRVAEAAESLRHHLGQVEHDPAREAELEQRIADLQELARKHRVAPQELPELFERLERELETLDGSDERLRKLGAESAALRDEVDLAAQKLTAARTKAAKKLGKEVTEHMQKLGMPGGHFEAEVRPAADGKTGPHGADRIEFLATANPGHAPGPLAQVASGGELSRLNLSIQVVAIGRDQVPTLIFDEVDSGVGGGVAEIVGGRLRDLSLDRQVLCVTHLPQVASQADHHLRVTKISDGKATRTSVKGLTKPERVEEIARMLGGVEITARTRAHAAEMLSGSKLRESAG